MSDAIAALLEMSRRMSEQLQDIRDKQDQILGTIAQSGTYGETRELLQLLQSDDLEAALTDRERKIRAGGRVRQ